MDRNTLIAVVVVALFALIGFNEWNGRDRYQMTHAPLMGGAPAVFILHENTGELVFCYRPPGQGARRDCEPITERVR